MESRRIDPVLATFCRGQGSAVAMEPVVALVYDDDAYVEAGGVAPGLMGRQVAGRSFLEALLRDGSFSELVALVQSRERAASLLKLWREHQGAGSPSRKLRVDRARSPLRIALSRTCRDRHSCPPASRPSVRLGTAASVARTRLLSPASRTRCALPRPWHYCNRS